MGVGVKADRQSKKNAAKGKRREKKEKKRAHRRVGELELGFSSFCQPRTITHRLEREFARSGGKSRSLHLR